MSLVRLIAVLTCGALLAGCAGAPIMLAADVVSAAVKASVEHAEKNRPTPEEALAELRIDLLRARADQGDAAAQYALALQLQSEASAEARVWMCRAGNQGHPTAQLNLGHWYNEDRVDEDLWPYIRVRPDNRDAYVWYSLAATNGDTFAPLFRRRLLDTSMSSDDVVQAAARLDGWTPSGCGYFTASDSATSTPER